MGELFQELKRRNIFRVGAAYLVLAWFILQVGSVLAPILSVPPSALSIVVFLLVLGFPFSLLFAWAFELTPDGLKRTSEVSHDTSVTSETGSRLNRITIGILAAVIVVLLGERFLASDRANNEAAMTGNSVLGDQSYDSIAVLPFVNMSDDKAQEFFSDGISEELLNLLAKTRGLRVAARTSSFAFKGQNEDVRNIGEQLDVQTVLEGSVRKSDQRLRITAQLIDVGTGYHLWSETFDRELTDIFAIQDEISASIVEALSVHLDGVAVEAPKSSPGDVRAYEEYLKGRQLIGLRGLENIQEADKHFKKALGIDPDFAPAWAGRSDAIMLQSDFPGSYGEIPVAYAFELAEPMAKRALELDPNLPDAHTSLGRILQDKGEDDAALRAYDKAIALRSSSPIAQMWRASVLGELNRWGEQRDALVEAHKADPKSAVVLLNWANVARESFNIDDLEFILRKADGVLGDKERLVRATSGYLQRANGQYAEAFKTYGGPDELAKQGDLRANIVFTCFRLAEKSCMLRTVPGIQSWAYMAFGDFDEAEAAIDQMEEFFPPEEIPDRWFVYGQRMALAVGRGDWPNADKYGTLMAEGDPFNEHGNLFSHFDGEQALAWLVTKHNMGDEAAVRKMTETLKRFRERQKANGAEAYVPLTSAMIALYGDQDTAAALGHLRVMKDRYLLGSLDRFNPFFKPLRDDPGFLALMDEVDAHVNTERAKLGWPPLDLKR